MAQQRMSEADLQRMGIELVPGTTDQYRKKKTVKQPRGSKSEINDNTFLLNIRGGRIGENHKVFDFRNEMSTQRTPKKITGQVFEKPNLHKITLILFGIPMPKQSVRSANGKFWQPKETTDRKNNYILQIKSQLPKDFIPFANEVHVRKFHCVYPPLKSFHKEKGKIDAIREGKIFYKNTQPDLIDNLKKLVFDSMAKIVLKNDGLIVTENDTAKYYGVGGCLIIEMEGY